MMSMFRKLSQLLKKRGCVVLFTICLISPFFVVSASAENVEAKVFARSWYLPMQNDTVLSWDEFSSTLVDIPRVNNHSPTSSVNLYQYSVTSVMPTLVQYKVSSEDGFFGDVGFYLSYYFISDDGSGNSVWTYEDFASDIFVTVTDSNGNELEYITEFEYFTPVTDVYSHSIGITVSYVISVLEATPVISIDIGMKTGSFPVECITTYNGLYHLVVSSSALIADRTSEELQALQNLTNVVINQNNISNQYYGDIISKVDSLYTEVGNLADLQEQAIQQFDDWNVVTNVPGSVQNKVDKADQVIVDINSLVKPDPEQIVPDYLPDPEELHDISDILSPFFQNALIVQLCTMVLGFAFVSYVLFGKKG